MISKMYDILSLTRIQSITGALLLFWPSAFSIAINGRDLGDLWLVPLFFVGCLAMRSAGCIVNDICDKDIDRFVERTKDRPITSGRITVAEAIKIMSFIMIPTILLGSWLLSAEAVLGIMMSIPLLAIYPLMKRITYWPQFFLGLTFNFPSIIVALHIKHAIDINDLMLYIGCICWTLGYDTIYACMDYVDDMKVSIKSLAVKLIEEQSLEKHLFVFMILFSISLLYFAMHHHLALVIWCAVSMHLIWQVTTVNAYSSYSCMVRFKSNGYLGMLIFAMLFFTNDNFILN